MTLILQTTEDQVWKTLMARIKQALKTLGLLELQLNGAKKVELWVPGVHGVENRTFQKETASKQSLQEAGEGIL